jgi:DUF1009 family protein
MFNDKTSAPVGLIAGNRRLPFQFAQWAKRSGRELFIAGIRGEADARLAGEVGAAHYHDFYITNLSGIAKYFRKNGVREAVMIGGIARARLRPSLDAAKAAARLLFMKNKHKGIFTIIMSMFEKRGVRIAPIQELMPELLIGEGPLSRVRPADQDIAALNRNLKTILEYTRTGAGQAVVIHKGGILAYENIKGTDDLAKRAADKRQAAGQASGGFMAKIMEPGQDERADLPVVGTGTVETLAKYGINGVFVEAGRAIADDVTETAELADKLGIFVYGVSLSPKK